MKTGSAEFRYPRVVGIEASGSTMRCYFLDQSKLPHVASSYDCENFQVVPGRFPVASSRRLQFSKIDLGNLVLAESGRGDMALLLTRDGNTWLILSTIDSELCNGGSVARDFQFDGKYLLFTGGKSLRILESGTARDWNLRTIINLPEKLLPNESIFVDVVENLSTGLLICYRAVRVERRKEHHRVFLLLLKKSDCKTVEWISPVIWESDLRWGRTTFGGAAILDSQIVSIWNTSNFGTMLVRYPVDGIPVPLRPSRKIEITRSRRNPIIGPRDAGEFPWESFATYNPAAFVAEGKIHILYRAQGTDLISSIGYARSSNGTDLEYRASGPVYCPQEVFERLSVAGSKTGLNTGSGELGAENSSGGGIAGCEDPRATLIGERLYMTYVAFDGYSPPRVALTSIDLQDFLAERWIWQRPVLISPPGVVDKSAVIFPEKIQGKFVVLHRIFPDILMDFEDDLNFDGSRWLQGKYRISVRENCWDSRKIGAGAPPIKTKDGWLLIYYGVDDRDDRYYKIGAMLLDLRDPSIVLYRPKSPILEPKEWYENSGFKPGVAYPCGAVVIHDELFVYYGGADQVVCVASANLDEFLKRIKDDHNVSFNRRSSVERLELPCT